MYSYQIRSVFANCDVLKHCNETERFLFALKITSTRVSIERDKQRLFRLTSSRFKDNRHQQP